MILMEGFGCVDDLSIGNHIYIVKELNSENHTVRYPNIP